MLEYTRYDFHEQSWKISVGAEQGLLDVRPRKLGEHGRLDGRHHLLDEHQARPPDRLDHGRLVEAGKQGQEALNVEPRDFRVSALAGNFLAVVFGRLGRNDPFSYETGRKNNVELLNSRKNRDASFRVGSEMTISNAWKFCIFLTKRLISLLGYIKPRRNCTFLSRRLDS
jgi:hypothetical protein